MTDCTPENNDRTTDCANRNSRNDSLAVVGLVNDGFEGTLVCFQDDRPNRAVKIGDIDGLVGDYLVGIDYRPATNVLYGLDNDGALYTIDPATAAATFLGNIAQDLEGNLFGIDFNPTVDRLRIISDAGQNLRVNVDTGETIVDTPLSIPGTTPVNPATSVIGAAYTNNDGDAMTGTTLFDIDAGRDQTVIQAPANAGTLSATGALRLDATGAVGFDIYSSQRNGTTSSNAARR